MRDPLEQLRDIHEAITRIETLFGPSSSMTFHISSPLYKRSSRKTHNPIA
jgi:hypothetical protein